MHNMHIPLFCSQSNDVRRSVLALLFRPSSTQASTLFEPLGPPPLPPLRCAHISLGVNNRDQVSLELIRPATRVPKDGSLLMVFLWANLRRVASAPCLPISRWEDEPSRRVANILVVLGVLHLGCARAIP